MSLVNPRLSNRPIRALERAVAAREKARPQLGLRQVTALMPLLATGQVPLDSFTKQVVARYGAYVYRQLENGPDIDVSWDPEAE